MNIKRQIRVIHYWLSFFVAIPLTIVLVTGMMLMLKKQIVWIQPPTKTQDISYYHPNLQPFLQALAKQPTLKINRLEDIQRIDIQPSKGIAKLTLADNVEVQLRLSDYHIVSVATRRSDVIESLHDGSYFGSYVKYGVFLVSALLLFAQLITGLYLVFVTEKVRLAKKHSRKSIV